jgi:hypothetical protein
MKWELDDNARSGFHYLVFGVLVVAVLALANAALDSLHAPFGPNDSYGHGYLIEDDGDTMIVAHTTRGERLIAGILLSFVAAIIVAGVFALLAGGRRTAESRRVFVAGRVAFFASISYFVYAALYLPPREFMGMRDSAFILWERNVILNDLPWPKEKDIILIPFRHVEKVLVSSNEYMEGVVVHHILIDHASEQLEVGCSAATSSGDSAAAIFANERVTHLEQMMLRP